MSSDELKGTLQSANPFDLGIIVAGVLAFIASFLPYYTVSLGGFASTSNTAWHGFFGWFAMLLALVGAVLVTLTLLGTRLPVPVRLTVAALFGLALLCVIIAGLTWPGTGGAKSIGINVDSVTGHGFGYYLSLIVIAVGTALAVMRLNASEHRPEAT